MKRILVFGAVLIVASLFATGCTAKPSEANPVLVPYKTGVYFLILNSQSCDLLAYVPGGSVCVSIKVEPDTTDPYVDIPRKINNDNRYLGPIGEPYIAWMLGGTLYVKDVQQVKDLLLSAQGHD